VALEQALRGQRVVAVTAVGKHLLLRWQDHHVLHVHLGLTGMWHIRPSRRFGRFDGDRTALALGIDGALHRLDRPMLLRRMRATHLPHDRTLARLGPDLARPEVDLDAIARRYDDPAHDDRMAADVLLDQQIAAGIGNVFKNELLFLQRVAPDRRWRDVPAETRRALYADAARWIPYNIGAVERRTRTQGPATWVYGGRRPCLVCGGPIRRADLGAPYPRVTYWCPTCQT
jgi:endonuclease-8